MKSNTVNILSLIKVITNPEKEPDILNSFITKFVGDVNGKTFKAIFYI